MVKGKSSGRRVHVMSRGNGHFNIIYPITYKPKQHSKMYQRVIFLMISNLILVHHRSLHLV